MEKEGIPVNLLDQENASTLITTWFEVVHLKQIYRKGWLQRDIPAAECESVADHCFGISLLCLLLLPDHRELDPHRVLKLALIHDLGEAYVGDITPQDRVDSAVKKKMEARAIERILTKLPQGESLIADWHEYEAQSTPEARFVKEVDRLELAMQAGVYAHQGKVDPQAFFDAASDNIKDERMLEEVSNLRRLLADNNGKTDE